MTAPCTPSSSLSRRNSTGRYAPGRTSRNRAAGRSASWLSKRLPAWAPPWNELVRTPSTNHQSASSSSTTRGARSRYRRSIRSAHRSGGSTMWESDEIIFQSNMARLRWLVSVVVQKEKGPKEHDGHHRETDHRDDSP